MAPAPLVRLGRNACGSRGVKRMFGRILRAIGGFFGAIWSWLGRRVTAIGGWMRRRPIWATILALFLIGLYSVALLGGGLAGGVLAERENLPNRIAARLDGRKSASATAPAAAAASRK